MPFAEQVRRLQTDPIYAAEAGRRLDEADRERADRRRAFLEAFACPDPNGERAPCQLNDDTLANEIIMPPGCGVPLYVPCPVAATVRCIPLLRLETLRVKRERDLGRSLGIPDIFLDARLATSLPTHSVLRVKKYLADQVTQGLCLILNGGAGVGKTWAACAALRARGTGTFFYFPALCGSLLDPQYRQQAVRDAKQTGLVVFDDLGVEYQKEGGLISRFIDEIVWHREAYRLPTIVTTNLSPDQLRARLSDRVVDRLRGDWGCLCEIQGASLRRKRKED